MVLRLLEGMGGVMVVGPGGVVGARRWVELDPQDGMRKGLSTPLLPPLPSLLRRPGEGEERGRS